MPGPFATVAAPTANPANTSPRRIPSCQSERLPLQVQGRRAPVERREGHSCDSCLVSSFHPLPSPNRRLVLHPTLGRLGSFGKATEGRSLYFAARTWLFTRTSKQS